MRVPLGWLRRYVDLDAALTSTQIAERLAALGFPVDAITPHAVLSGVVAGRLDAVDKHPNADRLQVCTVDVGTAERVTIATGADNVAAGQIVPVALVGAHVIGRGEDGVAFDLHIVPRKMRGVESSGMLCSAGELGLEPGWFEEGIMQLDAAIAPGTNVLAALDLQDDVLDVEVTANRPDALGILGIARELAASLGLPLRLPAIDPAPPADRDPEFRITLESTDCRRFVGRAFAGVHVGPAPAWMRVTLALAGQRPIDNLVDISNFVMLETGQPLHFYDAARIAGRHIVVRDARPGERLTTLDDAERTLDARALVIADDDGALGLAGIKGGAASGVDAATTELFLEAATFAGPRIRRTAIALGLRTEASARNEKSLPPGLAGFAAARAAHLLLQEPGVRARPPVVAGPATAAPPAIALRRSEIPRLLGVDFSETEVREALTGLGFSVTAASDAYEVVAPYWRADVTLPADVVEEIARVVGYDRIVETVPPVFAQAIESSEYARERQVAHALAALGYREALTYALQPASIRATYDRAGLSPTTASVEILNPLSEDQRYMRFSLVPGLLALAERQSGEAAARTFEIGHVFSAGSAASDGNGSAGISERAMLAWMLVAPAVDEPAWRDSGFLSFKGESLALLRAVTGVDADVAASTLPGLHPGKTAALTLDGTTIATIGALDPRLARAFGIGRRVYLGSLELAALPAYRVPVYVAPSRFPAVTRDFALVLAPEVTAAAVASAVRAAAPEVVRSVRVFDEYRGPQVGAGRKSLAVRAVLQRADATLTDKDVEGYVAAILTELRERSGAQIRD